MMTHQQQMQELLRKSGIPSKEIRCFGSQVLITAWSYTAAKRWVSLLSKFCSKVRCVESIDNNAVNENTVLNPSFHKVWRVGGTI